MIALGGAGGSAPKVKLWAMTILSGLIAVTPVVWPARSAAQEQCERLASVALRRDGRPGATDTGLCYRRWPARR
jgi:hypothetical protein